jgi:hypothetical protein
VESAPCRAGDLKKPVDFYIESDMCYERANGEIDPRQWERMKPNYVTSCLLPQASNISNKYCGAGGGI